MKKSGILALVLALCLMLTGCMTGGMVMPPETLGDGTPWDGTWVNMAGRVGVEQPEGFDLLTTNGALEDMDIQYATWVVGEGTEIDKNTYVYDAQVYLMTELCGSADAAEQTMDEWYGQFDGTLTLTERETVTVDGAALELLHYDAADSHFARGVCAIWRHDDIVLVADIACIDGMALDLTEIMTDFLAGFHYV